MANEMKTSENMFSLNRLLDDLSRVLALKDEAKSLDKEKDKDRLAEIKEEMRNIAAKSPIVNVRE